MKRRGEPDASMKAAQILAICMLLVAVIGFTIYVITAVSNPIEGPTQSQDVAQPVDNTPRAGKIWQ